MILALVISGAALAALLFLWSLARGQSVAISGLEDLEGHTCAVDLAAFRNLVNPDEEAFLRSRLSARDFRMVQRKRNRAALQYLSWTAHNAAVLLRLGEAARKSPDPSVAKAAEELISAAMTTRLYVFRARLRLYVGVVLPGASASMADVLAKYEHLRDRLQYLGRLQHPVLSARISASI